MKKYYFIIILVLILIQKEFLVSQSISIFDIDTTNFPVIKAKFYVFDEKGNQMSNLQVSGFELTENNQKRQITKIISPSPKPLIKLSSVLTVEATGWTGNGNIMFAKEVARAWVENINQGNSECAVTSFTNDNLIYQDFTENKDVLLSSINSINGTGNTSFDAALINPPSGGILIAQTGKYKKILLLLCYNPEGLISNLSYTIDEAKKNNVEVYVLSLLSNCPEPLKAVAINTGGKWYEKIRSVKEAKNAFREIRHITQGGIANEIEWTSGLSCGSVKNNVNLKLISKNISCDMEYISPVNMITKLNIEPYSLSLLNTPPNIFKDTTIKVTAINSDFDVKNIKCSNPAFSINPTSFHLKSGESILLKVSVIPPDSGYIFTKFEFENSLCPINYYVNSGFINKTPKIQTLKIIQPNGGEVFVVGSDTMITWEGISPDDYVKIEYTTDNGISWILIADTVKGLEYNWKIPRTPSDKCLARITFQIKYDLDLDDMVLIPAGKFIMGNTGATYVSDYETPTREVTITRDFLMCKYEVTQKKFVELMGSNPSPRLGDSLPVERVTWYEAVEFCNKLSEKRGLQPCYSGSGDYIVCDFSSNGYRLPTEAEWEYACKANTTTDLFLGNLKYEGCFPADENLSKIGWFCGNTTIEQIVGRKMKNPFGLYDMNGSVCEWVWDWIAFYPHFSQTDPKGPENGTYRAVRGGAWSSYAANCRSANRHFGYTPDTRHVFGFRIVRSY